MRVALMTGALMLSSVSSTNALSIEIPDCYVEGVSLYVEKPYQGDIRLASGWEVWGGPEWLFVSACSAKKELRMMLLSRSDDQNTFAVPENVPVVAQDRVIDMIASAESFTLAEVSKQLTDLLIFSEIKSIPTDHCICTFEAT